VKQRQQFPHLKVEHHVRHVDLPNDRILLIVDIEQSNVGTVKVTLPSAHVKVYSLKQNLAAEQTQAAMPQLQNPEFSELPVLSDRLLVEPGERNQLHYELPLA
jgi:hypothetical protein